MPKIKNQLYNEFINGGFIKLLTIQDIEKALNNIPKRYNSYIKQARALLLVLFYTGCRPAEAVLIKGSDITKENDYIIIQLKGLKKGISRKIYLSQKHKYVNEIYEYAISLFPEAYIFYKFKSDYKVIIKNKEYIDIAKKIYYFIKKTFQNAGIDISPYYLRHNRFSSLSEAGATPEQIRYYKGARSIESVIPYLHISQENMKKINKFIK